MFIIDPPFRPVAARPIGQTSPQPPWKPWLPDAEKEPFPIAAAKTLQARENARKP
jgi:hypothetical protein